MVCSHFLSARVLTEISLLSSYNLGNNNITSELRKMWASFDSPLSDYSGVAVIHEGSWR